MMYARTSDPIFIVGMNGSGTTVLLDCLNNHPHLYGFRRETKILTYYMEKLETYGNLENDTNFLHLYNDIRNEAIFRIANERVSPPLPDNWREMPRSLSAVFDNVLLYFAEKDQKRRWCEKTPLYGIYLTAISQHFPTSKFIHIIRDGRACAASLHRRWGYKPELSIYKWKNVVQETRKQGKMLGPNNYIEIRYEDLATNPRETMKQLCNFLNESFSENLISPSRIRRFTGTKSKTIHNFHNKFQTYFKNTQIERLEKIAGKDLAELNYETFYQTSDSDPPRYKLIFWYYKDYTSNRMKTIFKAVATADFVRIQNFFMQSKAHIRTRYKI